MLEARGVDKYFVFDMSVPEFMQMSKLGLNSFLRLSDVEHDEALSGLAGGAWLDAMIDGYFPTDRLVSALQRYPYVALVSPELHQRPHRSAWSAWQQGGLMAQNERVMMCTDLPEDAVTYLDGF